MNRKLNFSSLIFKISFFVSLLMFFCMVVITGVFVYFQQNKLAADIIKDGKVFSSFSTKAIYDDYVQFYTHPTVEDFETFKALTTARLANNPDVVGVSLIAYNGRILFDSDEFVTGKASEQRTVSDEELLAMLKSEEMVSRTLKSDDGESMTEIVLPLPEVTGGHLFSMRYLISNNSLSQSVKAMYIQMLWTVIPLLILVVALAIPYTITLAKPITALTKTAEKIKNGEYEEAQVTSSDEIGVLASVFNEMMASLKKSQEKLSGKVSELEVANTKINQVLTDLQKEKIKLSASIESMPVGFFMIDVRETLIIVNELANKVFGVSHKEDAYAKLKTLLATSVDLHDYVTHCTDKTKPIKFDALTLDEKKIIKVVVSPILSHEGTNKMCIGAVVLVEDVTEAKVMERSKDEFFSIASHELRTPLTAIRGNTSMIRDMYPKQLKQSEMMEMIDDVYESSVRLINIVNDFLKVSSLEMGKLTFKNEEFDLVALGEEVFAELGVEARTKKLKLIFTKPKTAKLPILADRDRVKEVLVNLVGNAIKYTKKGSVTLEMTLVRGGVKVVVTDTGEGISPENQKLLFHKFQQAGSSLLTRDTASSSGLGLYISKLIVDAMGGKIWLESTEIGKGSEFAFSLGTNSSPTRWSNKNSH